MISCLWQIFFCVELCFLSRFLKNLPSHHPPLPLGIFLYVGRFGGERASASPTTEAHTAPNSSQDFSKLQEKNNQ